MTAPVVKSRVGKKLIEVVLPLDVINKAMIEIPPKFAGNPPVNPEASENEDLVTREWNGAQGLAEDVRYYGQWMRDEAEKRIGQTTGLA